MNLSEKDLKLFKKWLISHLKYGTVTVTFQKKDGSDRVMKCTLNETLMPLVENKKQSTRKVNEEVLPVFDIESNSWKSFRWESIKSVSFTLG